MTPVPVDLPGGRRGERAPRRLWPWVLAVVVLLAAYGGWSTVRLLGAVHRLEDGIASARQVRSELTVADLASGTPEAGLSKAAADFASAQRSVGSGWLAPLTILPFAGRQLRSVRALSAAAATVSSAARSTIGQAQQLLTAPHVTAEERTALLGRLSSATTSLAGRVQHLDLGPSKALVGTLASKRAEFQDDLTKLRSGIDKAAAATTAVSQLFREPGRYLVVGANNAEMRDGSGMYLQAGVVSVSNGTITVSALQPTADLSADQPAVPLSGDLASRWAFERPNQEWRNLGLSPQLSLNAPVAVRMWEARTGQKLDGVVVIDVAAIADLLRATGPVHVGSTAYTADTVEQQLLVGQYQGITSNDAANGARREQVGALAGATLGALEGPGLSLAALGEALDDAANGRHLMVWAADPAREAEWQAAGVGGTLAPSEVLLGLLNQGANKMDPFQTVTASMTLAPQGDETAVTVRATVHNAAPTTLSPYAGDGTPGPRLTYNGALALDLPAYAGRITSAGGRGIETAGRDGPSDVIAVTVTIPDDSDVTVTWSFVLLGRHGALTVAPSARLPPVGWTVSGGASSVGGPNGSFTDATAHSVSW